MSKRRNRGTKANPRPPKPVTDTPPASADTTSDRPAPQPPPPVRWTTGDYVGLVGGIVGAVGLVVASLSWSEARESRKIAAEAHALGQKTYDRGAGKVGARFALLGVSPPPGRLPAAVRFPVDGREEVRLPSLSHLRVLNPRLLVKNTGEEPIDAVRLETRVEVVGVEFGGKVVEKEFGLMAAWRHGHVESEDVAFGRKLLPGRRRAFRSRGACCRRSSGWARVTPGIRTTTGG